MVVQPHQGHRGSPLRLVELFALPGAGKSTVVKAAAARARITTRNDLSAEWADCAPLERLVHVGRAFRNYRHLIAAARFGGGARLASRDSQFRLWRLVAKTAWLRSRTGVVVLDQGFLQDLWSILLSSNATSVDPALLASLIRTLYGRIDATIIVLAVDPETASVRVAGRKEGGSRFDGLPEIQVRKSLDGASKLHQQIVDAALLAGLTVQVIDGALPTAVVTDQLLALLPAVEPRKSALPNAQRPRRISIVGATGSGKSWLARQMAEQFDLPICDLDQLRRDAAAGESPEQTFRTRVAELVDGDEWIFDGHYRDVRHLIWGRAETVVWLNYPLRIVASRLVTRFRHKQSARAGGASLSSARCAAAPPRAGEGVSWTKRLSRLVRTLRERSLYGRLLRSAEYQGVQTVELRSIKATREWLREF